MTDDRRLSLERFFDGEADGACPAPDDPEARAYLARLALLRKLARRHDPASAPSAPFITSAPLARNARAWVLAAASLAASVLAIGIAARLQRGPGPQVADSSPLVRAEPAKSSRVVTTAGQRTSPRSPEVGLYRWANEASPRPEEAARVVLSGPAPRRGRGPSREVLALELANAPPGPADRLSRSAAVHASGAPSRRHVPNHRPRPSAPPRA